MNRILLIVLLFFTVLGYSKELPVKKSTRILLNQVASGPGLSIATDFELPGALTLYERRTLGLVHVYFDDLDVANLSSSYTLSAELRVRYKLLDSEEFKEETRFVYLSYDRNLKGGSNVDEVYLKYDGVSDLQVSVTSVSLNNAGDLLPITFTSHAYLELEFREDVFVSPPQTVLEAGVTTIEQAGVIESFELSVTEQKYVDGYEYEFDFIEAVDLSADYEHSVDQFSESDISLKGDAAYDFEKSSTKIVSDKSSYSRHALFGIGYFVFRYRYFSYSSSDLDRKIYSDWSCELGSSGCSGKVSDLDPAFKLKVDDISKAFEWDMNWTYQINYAEEDRRQESVSFFDGLNKPRQSVVYKNSDLAQSIVSESVYDVYGRKVIDVLPAPSGNSRFSYYHNYNVDASNEPFAYSGEASVTGNNACAPSASPTMGVLSGASRYYSSLGNTELAGVHQNFVPDAEGYPYVRTDLERSPEGRVLGSNMPGLTHSFGRTADHTNRYVYLPVEQWEIDRLFGTNAGLAEYYNKTLVRDPNDQLTLSYYNQRGQVVATSLLGTSPSNLMILGGIEPLNLSYNLLSGAYVERLNPYKERQSKSFYQTEGATTNNPVEFDFSLNIVKATLAFCEEALPKCYDCSFVVEAKVVDDCGETTLLVPKDVLLGPSQANVCEYEIAEPTIGFNNFSKGEYQLVTTKELSQEKMAEEFALFLSDNSDCVSSFEEMLEEEISVLDLNSCIDKKCEDACASLTDIKDRFECESLCLSITPCEIELIYLRSDVSPGGQFGQLSGDIHSVFNPSSALYYKNAGLNLMVLNDKGEQINLGNLTLDELVEGWQVSWADVLLPLHPEYSCYQSCINEVQSILSYKDFLMSVDDYEAARSASLLYPFSFAGNTSSIVANDYVPVELRPSVGSLYTDPLEAYISSNALAYQVYQNKMHQALAFYISETPESPTQSNSISIWEWVYLLSYNNAALVGGVGSFSDITELKVLLPQNFIQSFGNGNGVTCLDKDLYWDNFRSMYLSTRSQVLNDMQSVYYESCNTSWIYEGEKKRRFSSIEIPIDAFDDNENVTVDANGNFTVNPDLLLNECKSTCEAEADYWLTELSECFGGDFESAEAESLRVGFIQVCQLACDEGNLNGAVNSSFKSFNNVIVDVLGKDDEDPLRLVCNDLLITDLGNFDKPLKGVESNPYPDACACDAYAQAADEMGTYGFNSLEAYLEYKYDVSAEDADLILCKCIEYQNTVSNQSESTWDSSYEFSDEENKDFNKLFRDNNYNLSVISSLACNICVDCATYDAMKLDIDGIISSFPEDIKEYSDIEKAQYEQKIIQNYINRQLGASMTYEEYLDFDQRCKAVGEEGYCDANDELLVDLKTWFNRLLKEGNFYNNACLCSAPYDELAENGHRYYSDVIAYAVDQGFSRSSCDQEYDFIGIEDLSDHREIKTEISYGGGSCELIFKLSGDDANDSFLQANLEHIREITSIELVPTQSEEESHTFLANAVMYVDRGNGQIQIRYVTLQGSSPCFDLGTNCTNSNERLMLCQGDWSSKIKDGGGNGCISDKIEIATTRAIERYESYYNELRAYFESEYVAGCMQSETVLKRTVSENNYPFTLYYYDLSGNLVQTVPPEGFSDEFSSQSAIDAVAAARSNGTNKLPINHAYHSTYKYNSLNQVVETLSPDRGKDVAIPTLGSDGKTNFWYNSNSLIVASQDPSQNQDGRISYTVYDGNKRIVEVGETDFSNLTAVLGGNKRPNVAYDVTRTTYGESMASPKELSRFIYGQKNLINRISAVEHYERLGSGNSSTVKVHAYHYSYDVHGNVRELVQSFFIPKALTFHMLYDYDLISGNVKQISYQKNEKDAFYHKYLYDADNRLETVYSSTDGDIWDKDSKYEYYNHGPLARMELGAKRVQGMDYAYTIQGWLKGVNSTTLSASSANDMMSDGLLPESLGGLLNNVTTGDANSVAKDALAYQLNYFANDYKSLGQNQALSRGFSNASNSDYDLFNGNIQSMQVGLRKRSNANGQPIVVESLSAENTKYNYRYDQYNRLRSMYLNTNDQGSGLYHTDYEYDFNGNLESLIRADQTGNIMDNLSYTYTSGSNQLLKVRDMVTDNAADENNDFISRDNNRTENDYAYDMNGNLVKDYNSYIDQIEWTATGKVRRVLKETTALDTALDSRFYYDAMGNRSMKVVKPKSAGTLFPEEDWRYTYYVRDAQGNVLATYSMNVNKESQANVYRERLTLDENYIYGSDRLGSQQRNVEVANAKFTSTDKNEEGAYVRTKYLYELTEVLGGIGGAPTGNSVFSKGEYKGVVRGQKRYELKNHLGNVMAVISDRKRPSFATIEEITGGLGLPGIFGNVTSSITNLLYVFQAYIPEIVSTTEYYPFGSTMPGRNFSSNEYRYGFNGMEKDDEIKGSGNSYTTEFRGYDPRLGRFMSLDPLSQSFPWQSPYSAMNNNPINMVDPNGDAPYRPKIYHRRNDPPPAKGSSYVKFHYFKVETKTGTQYVKTMTFHNVEKSVAEEITKRHGTASFTSEKSDFGFQGVGNEELYNSDERIEYTTIGGPNDLSGYADQDTEQRGSQSLLMDVGSPSGQIKIEFNTNVAADKIQIVDPNNGNTIWETNGYIKTGANEFQSSPMVDFQLGMGTEIQVNVISQDGNPASKWAVRVKGHGDTNNKLYTSSKMPTQRDAENAVNRK